MKVLPVNSNQTIYSNNSNNKNKSDIAFGMEISPKIKTLLEVDIPQMIRDVSSTPNKQSDFLSSILGKIPLLEKVQDGLKLDVIELPPPPSPVNHKTWPHYYFTVSKEINGKLFSANIPYEEKQAFTLRSFLTNLNYLLKGDNAEDISKNVNKALLKKYRSFIKPESN